MDQQNKYYKPFVDKMNSLSQAYGHRRIFDDFLQCAMCALHETNIATRLQVKDEANEAEYLKVFHSYQDLEIPAQFGHLLKILQLAILEDPYGDILGEFFTEHITMGHNGQFFTPASLTELMAQLTVDPTKKGQHVNDCACGSGRILLGVAKVAPGNYFFGNDVELTCARMTAINMMLNGLRGEVAWMNTLTLKVSRVWRINMGGIGLGIRPIPAESSLAFSHGSTTGQTAKPPQTSIAKVEPLRELLKLVTTDPESLPIPKPDPAKKIDSPAPKSGKGGQFSLF